MKYVKRGSVTIPVYHTPRSNGEGWTVAYREPSGQRRRIFRSSLAAAKLEAEAVATRLANVQDVLVGPEAQEASQARQLAQAAGCTLLGAVQGFCSIKARLNGKGSPDAAVDYFLSRATEVLPDVSISQIRDEFLIQQKQDGISQPYLDELEGRLKPFCESLSCPPALLTAKVIEEWLRAQQKARGWSGRTRNHCRAAISNLLNFARRKGYLPRTWAEMGFVSKATEEDEEIGIYTPAELLRILERVFNTDPNKDLQPFVVLGAFTGARPSEILRLRWEDFHWESSELFIGIGKVRKAGHRIVPLLPACVAWLNKLRKTSGRVATLEFFSSPLVGLVRSAGVKGIRDGLRHSFISYRRAVTKDLALVSGEVGTDTATLTRRYCRPVKLAEAEAWFAARPG